MQSATKIWQNLPPNKNLNSSLTLRNAPVSKKNIGFGFSLNKDVFLTRHLTNFPSRLSQHTMQKKLVNTCCQVRRVAGHDQRGGQGRDWPPRVPQLSLHDGQERERRGGGGGDQRSFQSV